MKNFSPRAKEIVSVLAQDEARQLGSKQLLPEHVILAMIKNKEGLAYQVFDKLLLEPEALLDFIQKFFSDEPKTPTLDSLPVSRRYQQLIDIADIEANALHNDYIGTEHLLLAAIREEGSITNRFFKAADYTIMDARFVVMELQGEHNSSIRQARAESLVDTVFKSLLGEEGGLFDVFDESNPAKASRQDKTQNKKKELFLTQ